MSPNPFARRTAAWLIRLSCRRLPEEAGAERCQEWSAELHAILDDRSVRPGVRRAARALRYSAGVWRATGHLSPPRSGPGRAPAPAWRDGAMRARPGNTATRATAGFLAWLVVIFTIVALFRAFVDKQAWLLVFVLLLAASFDALCLADIARADEVRYLPKWAWALICLVQTPSGGIAYLILGRVARTRPAGPESARS